MTPRLTSSALGTSAAQRAFRNADGRGARQCDSLRLEAAQTEYVAVFMADMSDGPEILNAMLAAADAGADVISASRYMKGGSQTGGPWLRDSCRETPGDPFTG